MGNLVVHVRATNGSPLSNAIVTLYNELHEPTGINPVRLQDGLEFYFQFSGLLPGRYTVEATAVGFDPVKQPAELTGADQSEAVLIFLKPAGASGDASFSQSSSVLTPKAQKEVQTAIRDLQSKKYESALKHLNDAQKMAPQNASIQYLLGMSYVLTDRPADAKKYLDKALALEPRHLQSLLTLGDLRYRAGDYAGARELFSRAVEVSPNSWQPYWMLAKCELRLNNFAPARDDAERAIELGHEKAGGAELLLAEALSSLGENKRAADVLSGYLQTHSQDPNAEKIRGWIAELERPAPVSALPAPIPSLASLSSAASVSAAPLTVAPSPKESWAPPDTDAAVPTIDPGVACSLSDVLAATGKRSEELVTHLEQFSALEYYEAADIGRDGQVTNTVSAAFNYLVTIHKVQPDLLMLDEHREQNKLRTSLPGQLQDLGSPAIVLVFHPRYQDDFEMKCEGLGHWNHQATWLIHFQQRPDRPARLRDFATERRAYPMRLRGRAWISAENFQIVHLESDLLEPVAEVELRREHMAVDYQIVLFPKRKVELWLPQQVDIYFDYRGHFYHHYHQFSNFHLFSVDTRQQIAEPK